MSINYHDDLLSRKFFVEQRLADLPDSAIMSRFSLEQQLDELKKEILDLESNIKYESTKAIITFSGDPVDGSRGILPGFATKAISAFSDMINTFKGKDATKDDELYITNIAHGSFGFTLEENIRNYVKYEQLGMDIDRDKKSPVGKALDQILLFFKNADTEDDLLSENISDIDDKALNAIRKFINVLDANNALCSIKSKELKFSFLDTDHIIKIKETLTEGNIKKETKVISGAFTGLLPDSRTGEFTLNNTSADIIKIKIPKVVAIPDITSILHKKVRIKVIETSVKNRKPSYSLEENETLIF